MKNLFDLEKRIEMKKNIVGMAIGILLIVSVGMNVYFYKLLEGTQAELHNKESQKEEIEKEIVNSNEEINNLDNEIVSKTKELEDKETEEENLEIKLERKSEEIKQIKEEKIKAEQNSNNGKSNNGEQSSTSGGIGNSQTSGAPGGDANVPDEPSGGMSLEDAAAKFGMTYGGSGIDTSGFDHGDGGHGTIFE